MLAVTAEETESTNAKGIEFANPNSSQKRIASMEIGIVVPFFGDS